MKATLRTFKTACVATFILIAGISRAATYTAVASGDWSNGATWGGVAPGNNVILDDIIIPAGVSVGLDQDVTFSGLLSSLEVQGTLQSTNGSRLMMDVGTLTGGGVLDLKYLSFGSGLTSMTFSGTLTVEHLVNSSSVLAFSAIVNVGDSLELDGGTITLNSGANLSMGTNSHVVVNNGVFANNGGIFAGGAYTVTYIGTAKNTGLEAMGMGLKRLIMMMDANEDLTLGSDVTVNDYLSLNSGTLILNGYDLIINGNYLTSGPATIAGSTTSSIRIKNTSGLANGIRFEGGAEMLEDLIVDIPDDTSLLLLSNLTVYDTLRLTKGDVEIMNGASLAMAANSDIIVQGGHLMATNGTFDGSAMHNLTFFGLSKHTGIEASGSGLNKMIVALNTSSDTVSLNSNVTVDTLALGLGILSLNGAHLTVSSSLDGTGTIHGHSSSNLTISTADADTVNFTAGAQTLNKLSMNIANGGYLYIGSDLTVNTLSFGTPLKITNSHITVNTDITGYDDNSYVMIDGSGTLRMNVNTSTTNYTVFPVGTTKSYSPASLQVNTGGATGMYHVGLRDGVSLNGTSGTDLSATESMLDRTWDINTTATGSVNMNVKLGWTDTAEVNGFNRNIASVIHYTGGQWTTAGTWTAATTTAGVHEVTRMNVTSLSPFSVADSLAELDTTGGGPTTVAENVIAVSSVYPNPVKDELNCVLNISNDAVINIMDITGRVIYTENILRPEMNEKHTIDFSKMPSGVYFISIRSGESQIIK